mmetsp:Transcript_3434/g.10318  ORF Transcript_3434/g.10318 Transcript_3434/m.10318 type:complete len:264 (-) Transcript_3434:431-1222(-)
MVVELKLPREALDVLVRLNLAHKLPALHLPDLNGQEASGAPGTLQDLIKLGEILALCVLALPHGLVEPLDPAVLYVEVISQLPHLWINLVFGLLLRLLRGDRALLRHHACEHGVAAPEHRVAAHHPRQERVLWRGGIRSLLRILLLRLPCGGCLGHHGHHHHHGVGRHHARHHGRHHVGRHARHHAGEGPGHRRAGQELARLLLQGCEPLCERVQRPLLRLVRTQHAVDLVDLRVHLLRLRLGLRVEAPADLVKAVAVVSHEV